MVSFLRTPAAKGVDDPPEHDDPRVEVFLTDSFPSEESRADAEHEALWPVPRSLHHGFVHTHVFLPDDPAKKGN
jgi:hypothetical protein